MTSLSDSIRYLTRENHMLASLCVAYGNARESAYAQDGHAQEYALTQGTLVPCLRPLPDHAVYDLASLTKLFTCVTLFRLIDAGKLRLDERVAQIDKRFTALGDATLYDICTYRACLQTDERIDAAPTREQALARVFTMHRAPLPPVRIYSDLNALLLGFVIEARTGFSLFEAVSAAVLRPAGLHETYMRVPESALERTLC